VSLRTAVFVEALLHRLPTSAMHLESIFALQFNIPHYTQVFSSADLQFISRPNTFWKYFSTGWTLPLQMSNSNIVSQFLQKRVNCSYELYF